MNFQECTQIRPSDWEVLFNWGNTLYRWARVKERDGDYKRALKRLRSASEKYSSTSFRRSERLRLIFFLNQYDSTCTRYVSVLDIEPANADALHNWGKVLYSQGTLIQKAKPKEQENSTFCRQVEVYLELFSTFACTCTEAGPNRCI